MIKEKMEDAFNGHLNQELFSAYLYLSMAAYLETKNLAGMANWMRIQVQEELMHASKFFDFVHHRGGHVVLRPIEGPKTEWKSPAEAFAEAYEHECKISSMIGRLVDLSTAEGDHAAHSFLQWFVNEQVEEEATALAIAEKLKLVADNGAALFMIDGELGQRTLSPPPAAA